MFRHIATAALVIVSATGLAAAQPEEASGLDDASLFSTPPGGSSMSAGAIDDAAADAGTELSGAMATGGPIAYATILSNGSTFSGTPNVSSSFNSTYNRYEITIAGEPYYYLNYATLVTPAGDSRFCRSSSVGGRLLVYCYDANGQVQPARFAFVTFKP